MSAMLGAHPLGQPASSATPVSVLGLRQLAAAGSWRAILEQHKSRRESGAAAADRPGEALSAATYHLLALARLRMFGAAAEELRALGDFDAPRYVDDASGGSLVPFALRFLAAELPYHLGQPAAALDALYPLLSRCTAELARAKQEAEAGGGESSPGPASNGDYAPDGGPAGSRVSRWRRRQSTVMYALAAHHLLARDAVTALGILDKLARRAAPGAPRAAVLSRCAHVQLQAGDLEAARRTLGLAAAEAGPSDLEGLQARLNRGLLLLASKDTAGALAEFEAVVAARPADPAAANNRALCLMFARDVAGAMRTLEKAVQAHPADVVEPLVQNLASIYELAAQNAAEAKHRLQAWLLAGHAPDDFDPACLRI